MRNHSHTSQGILAHKIHHFKILFVVVIVFGGVGTALLLSTHAATTVASIEAESGTLSTTGAASKNNDSTASSSSVVKFTSSGGSTATSCPPYPAIPTTSCAGVPSGYGLTSVSNGYASTASGQTIDGKLVNGDLQIKHDNVTVSNSRIIGHVQMNGHKGLVLDKVDIGYDTCPASETTYVFSVTGTADVGFTMKQSYLHNNGYDNVRFDGGTYLIQDSIINKGCFYGADGNHVDATQWYQPGHIGHVTIIHSDLTSKTDNSSDLGNAAIFWADGAASGTTLTAYNNRFAGGNITTALYDALKGSGIVLDLHDNTYVKNSYTVAPCSFGGSVKSIAFDGTSGVKFTNNKFEDGSAVSCN